MIAPIAACLHSLKEHGAADSQTHACFAQTERFSPLNFAVGRPFLSLVTLYLLLGLFFTTAPRQASRSGPHRLMVCGRSTGGEDCLHGGRRRPRTWLAGATCVRPFARLGRVTPWKRDVKYRTGGLANLARAECSRRDTNPTHAHCRCRNGRQGTANHQAQTAGTGKDPFANFRGLNDDKNTADHINKAPKYNDEGRVGSRNKQPGQKSNCRKWEHGL
jgi:hypothetical protein